MAVSIPSKHKCPVCQDKFKDPKLLSCTHLICHSCLLSRLQHQGSDAGCPLCHLPILEAPITNQSDIASQVDALPTDFVTAAEITSQTLLSEKHVCGCCDDVEAAMFCLQCGIKMCSSCVKIHAKIPLTQNHAPVKVSSLRANQVVLNLKSTCVNGCGISADLYCADHEEVICIMCATKLHHKCANMDRLAIMAHSKREELKVMINGLQEQETALEAQITELDTQVSEGQAKFTAMRTEVKNTFQDLQKSLKNEEEKLYLGIKKREDIYLTERKSCKLDVESSRVRLSAHRNTAERLVSFAPDASLLAMMPKLKRRLDDVKSKSLPDRPQTAMKTIRFQPQLVSQIKNAFSVVGQWELPNCKQEVTEEPHHAPTIKVEDQGTDYLFSYQTTLIQSFLGEQSNRTLNAAPPNQANPPLDPESPASPITDSPASPEPESPSSPIPECPASPIPGFPASPIPSCPASPDPNSSVSAIPDFPASPIPDSPASPDPEPVLMSVNRPLAYPRQPNSSGHVKSSASCHSSPVGSLMRPSHANRHVKSSSSCHRSSVASLPIHSHTRRHVKSSASHYKQSNMNTSQTCLEKPWNTSNGHVKLSDSHYRQSSSKTTRSLGKKQKACEYFKMSASHNRQSSSKTTRASLEKFQNTSEHVKPSSSNYRQSNTNNTQVSLEKPWDTSSRHVKPSTSSHRQSNSTGCRHSDGWGLPMDSSRYQHRKRKCSSSSH